MFGCRRRSRPARGRLCEKFSGTAFLGAIVFAILAGVWGPYHFARAAEGNAECLLFGQANTNEQARQPPLRTYEDIAARLSLGYPWIQIGKLRSWQVSD